MTQHVLTLIAECLADADVARAETALRNAGAQVTECVWLGASEACDLSFEGLDVQAAVQTVRSILAELSVDVYAQPEAGRRKRLLLSDMDSTIITGETIDGIAAYAGLESVVAAITERAMRGEMDFRAALKERVAMLKGLSVNVLEQTYREHLRFTPGAAELVGTMRKHGAHCVLVSGGFTYFTERMSDALGFHEHVANVLELEGGVLAGTVSEPIVDSAVKEQTLHRLCHTLGISPGNALTIGDGANDLPMLKAASNKGGLGIAYHAKPKVRAEADARLDVADLRGALYLQGYRREEFVRHTP